MKISSYMPREGVWGQRPSGSWGRAEVAKSLKSLHRAYKTDGDNRVHVVIPGSAWNIDNTHTWKLWKDGKKCT